MHKHSAAHERKPLIVIILTLLTMGAEIAFGYLSHSMALLADGYHMGTHALALGLTYIAYVLIRKFSGSARASPTLQQIILKLYVLLIC